MRKEATTLTVGDEEIPVTNVSFETSHDTDADAAIADLRQNITGSFEATVDNASSPRDIARLFDTCVITDPDGEFVGFADVEVDGSPLQEWVEHHFGAWLDAHRENDPMADDE